MIMIRNTREKSSKVVIYNLALYSGFVCYAHIDESNIYLFIIPILQCLCRATYQTGIFNFFNRSTNGNLRCGFFGVVLFTLIKLKKKLAINLSDFLELLLGINKQQSFICLSSISFIPFSPVRGLSIRSFPMFSL